MRVIAGKYRGRKIIPPQGRQTRPTTDRVRESLMSTLFSMLHGTFEGLCVCDAFAGSGAFGIECLSRGASWACLCDNSRQAIAAIKNNSKYIPASEISIQQIDVKKTLPNVMGHTIDLVFFDPPYVMSATEVANILSGMANAHVLAPRCVVAYEHSAKNSAEVDAAFSMPNVEMIKRKDFHTTSISFFRIVYAGTDVYTETDERGGIS